MSVFVVETYVVKVEKRGEFTPLLKRFLKFKKSHSKLFSGVKSWKLYKQDFGAVAGMYIEVWEYESLADMDKINKRIFENAGMKKIQSAFYLLIEPATFSINIWSQVA